MKQTISLVIALILGISNLFAARTTQATGRVVDQHGTAVEFASVILFKDKEQVAGVATSTDGRFYLSVPAGDYTLCIQFLGFEAIEQRVSLSDNAQLGEFVLQSASTKIEGVEVTAQLIRREADRFVVDVANAPSSIGKDGIELLQHAPGVWFDGEKFSIYGKSGPKVYVNERELKLEPEQLITYLRSLRAEEIQKLEIVPTTGADYDADSSGGIIRITLKKRRENGVEGSLSMRTNQGPFVGSYDPGANISYHTGRFDLNASGWASLGGSKLLTNEHTVYDSADKALTANSKLQGKERSGGGSIGAVYEINDHHSLGAEVGYMHINDGSGNDSHTDFTTPELLTQTQSRFDARNLRDNYEATFNYIWKIDTLGSTLKLLADYTHRTATSANNNHSSITVGQELSDSLFRDNTLSKYDIASATLSLDKKFSKRWSLRAGAKYSRNDMRNNALYEYVHDEAWVRNDNQSFVIDYTENIAAAYGIVSANLGRWSLVAGLRGEYTRTDGKGNVAQDYFSLFPNTNISYSLSKDGAYSLIAQYARTIERPRFWSLTPIRMQISDYTYQTGNPELNPAYKHEVSLTLVLKHKYTLTGGVNIQTDAIQEIMRADSENPNLLGIFWDNFDSTTSYYLSADLPFQLTKWWSLRTNLTYMRRGERVEQHGEQQNYNFWFANASTTFTLPAKFFIDISYNYMNQVHFGNCWVEANHRLEASLKKRFKERFTATFTMRNLLDRNQVVGAQSPGFIRMVEMQQNWNKRSYTIGVSYNFKAGKAFNRKAVEAGAADDKGRL